MRQAKRIEVALLGGGWEKRICVDALENGVIVASRDGQEDYLNNKLYTTATYKTWREIKEPKYVPFETYPNNLAGMVVKNKIRNTTHIIVNVYQASVYVNREVLSYKELLEHYVFLDGTPCGKIKED